jgi:hypothetical protein
MSTYTVTLASISQGSGPGFGVGSRNSTGVIIGAVLGKTSFTTSIGCIAPVVRLAWSSVIRQGRAPSWTLAGTSHPLPGNGLV